MSILSSILYGLIQGLCEFLPVSSSGHLVLFQALTGDNFDNMFAFNILLHLGTLVAVFTAYHKTVLELVPAFFRMLKKFFSGKFKLSDYDDDERFMILAIISTSLLIAAAFLDDEVSQLSNYVYVVGGILIVNGIMLFVSDYFANGQKTIAEGTVLNALAIGIMQLCAILPGLSRSGSTITGGLICRFKREEAVKYSFILSIPPIIAAAILEAPDLVGSSLTGHDALCCLLGAFTAGIVGFAAIKLIQYLAKKSNFRVFAYYCVAVGALTIINSAFKG